MSDELAAVQEMLARERLSIDDVAPGRTSFLTHLGAQARLSPGTWIAHRDLLYALALANLSPAQRTSLARAVLVDHGRTFGVGHLELESAASGLPLGGASLRMVRRPGRGPQGPSCLYTWALAEGATPLPCDWLLVRVEPAWALERPPRPLSARALATLHALEVPVVVLLATAVDARALVDRCPPSLPLSIHPRFLPHVGREDARVDHPDARVLLWPHDVLSADSLRRREPGVLVLVDAPEELTRAANRWAGQLPRAVEITHATCPGRLDRPGLAAFWKACGRPRVLLRGDPGWTGVGASWLRELGAQLSTQSDAQQLGLFS